MSDEPARKRSEADAELEREIRAGRKFSMADAIGRLAGPGMMKGVSPVMRKQQAEAEIGEYLSRHLTDSAGVLAGILLRYVKESEPLLKHPEQPLAVLAAVVRHILDSEHNLKELVREADVEWGRVFGERPRFQTEGCPPQADDPYTWESVRASLTQLIGPLTAGKP